MQAGIDEAGRAPVLGPLVVAGVAVRGPAVLAEMGCRDSKRLSRTKRETIDRMRVATPMCASRCMRLRPMSWTPSGRPERSPTSCDAAVAELARRLEPRLGMQLGSGYHDPHTDRFLRAWVAKFGDLPEGTRRSWASARRLLSEGT